MKYENLNYYGKHQITTTLRMRELISTMPDFIKEFFRALEVRTSANTRLSYAYDINVFFNFLITSKKYNKKSFNEFTLTDFNNIKALDIEEYLDYLKIHKSSTGEYITNGDSGLKRKLSSLRTLYAYLYKRELITNNPTVLVDMPKLHNKAIIRLDYNEIDELLSAMEDGSIATTKQEEAYFKKYGNRDLTILTLLLGTGIRVSELVGLDINSINFNDSSIKVTRKGGGEMFVYFGVDVEEALESYLEDRLKITALEGHEQALFLSSQRKRMGVRAVEKMVKKYSSRVIPYKKITPHKLRSTYGTALYKETGDIYLVADVLGHKDVNTTRKHYAALDEDRRREASQYVRLRKKP